MKLLFATLALFLFPIICFAQDAKVIELKPADAAMLKAKHDALQAAQKAYDDAQKEITHQYLEVGDGDPDAGSFISIGGLTGSNLAGSITFITGPCNRLQVGASDAHCLQAKTPTEEEKKQNEKRAEEERRQYRYQRKGWENGFQSSPDFRFIVPKPYQQPAANCGTFQFNNMTPTPAFVQPEWRYVPTHGASTPTEFDDEMYNGASFKEWESWTASTQEATDRCRKRNWKGSDKYYSAVLHEWEDLSCKSFKTVFGRDDGKVAR